jgi:hypothetical protein
LPDLAAIGADALVDPMGLGAADRLALNRARHLVEPRRFKQQQFAVMLADDADVAQTIPYAV